MSFEWEEWENEPTTWINDMMNYSGWKFFTSECRALKEVNMVRGTNVVFMSRSDESCSTFERGIVNGMIYDHQKRYVRE